MKPRVISHTKIQYFSLQMNSKVKLVQMEVFLQDLIDRQEIDIQQFLIAYVVRFHYDLEKQKMYESKELRGKRSII